MNHKSATDLTEQQKTEKLWQGGAALATGISALAILHDQVRSMRRQRKAIGGSSGGALALRLPEMKMAGNPVDSMLSAAAVGGLTYYGWNKLYQELRKRQLEKEVEEADASYTNKLQETVKVAAGEVGFTIPQYLKATPGAIMRLAAIAAGAGTYGLLESTFPQVKEKAEAGRPKKIVIKGFGTVHADGPGDGVLGELDKRKAKEQSKALMPAQPAVMESPEAKPDPEAESDPLRKAAFVMPLGTDDQKCAAVMLTMLLSENPELRMHKSALLGLVGSYKQEPESLVTLVKEAGMEAAIAASESGWTAFDKLSGVEKTAAVHQAFACPALRPTLASLAVAELHEVYPDMAKRAKAVHDAPGYAAVLTKMAALFFQVDTLQALGPIQEKSAAAQSMSNDLHRQLGTLGLSESTDAGGEIEESDAAYRKGGDPIDAFMAGKTNE